MKQIFPGQKLYGLDHLRALAIAQVFFFHYFIISKGEPLWLPGAAKFGWTGVDLFFVLSGFLISSQLFAQIKANEKISFRIFFLKRFFRIIPAYWFVLAIYFCLPFFREKEGLPSLWRFLTFTQNFGFNQKLNGAFSHAWSLCLEEHFYLLFPLLLVLLLRIKAFKKAYWILIILFFTGMAVRWYSFQYFYLPVSDENGSWIEWAKYIYYPTYCRLDGLLAGVAIAAVWQFLPAVRERISKHGNKIFILSLLILTAAYFLTDDAQSFNASVFGFPLVALGYGCMVVSAISPSCFLYKFNSKITTSVAALSYALYLTHKGIIHVTLQASEQFNVSANLMLIICIITCICGAWLLRIIIEKPFMKLRDKVIKH